MTAPAPGRMPTQAILPITAIKVGDRLRQDLGDLDGLQRSIARLGLLQPVLVTPEGRLLAGLRRVRACQALGWIEIPVTVVAPVTARKEAPHA